MQTVLFYVLFIFESVIIFHHELGPEHHEEHRRKCEIDSSREWLIYDDCDDSSSSSDKWPLIHLELLPLFTLIIRLLTPYKEWNKEKCPHQESHEGHLLYICECHKYIRNKKYQSNYTHEDGCPHTLTSEKADTFFLIKTKHKKKIRILQSKKSLRSEDESE